MILYRHCISQELQTVREITVKKNRIIRKIIRSKPTIEGAGVHLKRAFGFSEEPALDPFLLLDDFRSNDPRHFLPGFPWHPHRGIETITYVLEGSVEHGDSMGNTGVISKGDVQWMTAGSGIIHQEMPKGDNSGRMGGFQLWANLPASQKMMGPRYREVKHSQIPVITPGNGVTIRIISGKINGTQGPVKDVVIEPQYLDITLDKQTEYIHPTASGHTVFAYCIEGKALFCQEKEPFNHPMEGLNHFENQRSHFVTSETLVLFEPGEQVTITTEDTSVRFLLISGKPINEPVAWYGPIVMNTRDELQVAFEEYENGTFIKHRIPLQKGKV
jgi:quercetin 2,3-dioxygenase